jgi:cyclophilin family peptidyl-prolyl cis-trans isomerase
MMTHHPRVPRARAVLAAGLLLACAAAAGAATAFAQEPQSAPAAPRKGTMDQPTEKTDKKEVAVVKTSLGTIVFEFLPDVAPKMVQNFKELARSGFYNGTTFHRVIPGFMIQGGDPNSKDDDPTNDGGGNGPRQMPAEFTTKYHHERGIVSTARLGNDVNSGSCQFFIMHKANYGLDNQYTIFGRVVTGLDVVDKIAAVPRGRNDRPVKNVVMESVTIETR